MEWKVTYQNTPFCTSDPVTLLVKAASKAVAVVIAYDCLIRAGHAVNVSGYDFIKKTSGAVTRGFLTEEEFEMAVRAGMPDYSTGRTHITNIEPHTTMVKSWDGAKQLGEAMAALARIYLHVTGCSLPEFDSCSEIADKIIAAIEEGK